MDSPLYPLFITNIDSIYYQREALEVRRRKIIDELKVMQCEAEHLARQVYHIKNTVKDYPELFEGIAPSIERLDEIEKSIETTRRSVTNHTMTMFEPR